MLSTTGRFSILFLFILTLVFGFNAEAQENWPQNTYSSSTNPQYWKNRPPFPGYWQQDTYYRIRASLSEVTNVITGIEELTYYNNSPDTLTVIYFHLYQNSFQPGSYNEQMYKANKTPVYYGPYERQKLGTTIELLESEGKKLRYEIDNTIMKVYLDKPVLPNIAVNFKVGFLTFFDQGTMRRRMKYFDHNGVRQYDGVHWYPRISVYDRRENWTVDQHLDKEFYGDYGTYDVALTLPSQYILEATGLLLNEKEVLPDELKHKLDIHNFSKKPVGEKPSVIIQPDGTTKTWRFHAENVHDFAWTADPSYRIGEAEWNGIKCVALVQEENASRWQHTAEFTAKVIEIYSRDFGMYDWPKIVVADARDGMEYPMLTLCGGLEPDNRWVIAHEVGHEWFFGMLGNNETYRAFLDEGFTQFLTVWSMEAIDGKYELVRHSGNRYVRKHLDSLSTREQRLIGPYVRSNDDPDQLPINTHSDYFFSAIGHGGGYGSVYFRGGTMLYNLQYVLGDSLFRRAMQHYVSQWKFCHPYPEDFRNSISRFTKINLDWFFDQWLETNKSIDYAVKKVKRDTSGGYSITFKRIGEMQMPVDFTVIGEDGKKQSFTIPNTYFAKNTSWPILKPWIGWLKIFPTYTTHIPWQGKIRNVIIDTSNTLADANLLNNQLRCPLRFRFDWMLNQPFDRRYYTVYWRPDLWYNAIDGVKPGIHFEGAYLGGRRTFSLTTWYNTGLLSWGKYRDLGPQQRLNFNASYESPLSFLDRDLKGFVQGRILDGLYLGRAGVVKSLKGNNTVTLDYKIMDRPHSNDRYYLLYSNLWRSNRRNAVFDAELKHNYSRRKSYGNYLFRLRTNGPFSNYNYNALYAALNHTIYYRKFIIRNRALAQYAGGSSIPLESSLYLSGASPEEMMDNQFVRSRGFVPEQWLGYGAGTNHFQYGGGLNLRGYSGYLAPNGSGAEQVMTYRGSSGAAVNIEAEFGQYFKIRPMKYTRYLSLNPYLFFDGGVINRNAIYRRLQLAGFRMDAGMGTALTIKNWGVFQKARPLTLRFDMPFYLSDAPYGEKNIDFRWIAGVGRAF